MKQPFTLPPRDTWIDDSFEVATDADTVYALLSDIDRWPEWTPGLRAIKRFGKHLAGPGTHFLMVMDLPGPGLPLPCTMFCNEPRHIEWGGGALGSTIRHFMTLTPLPGNRTQVRHGEYATGMLALLTRPVARLAREQDQRWSEAIAAYFAPR